MLIITRKAGQSFYLGNKEVTIKILSISNHQVRIGVEASKDIYVGREEIFNQEKATNSKRLSHESISSDTKK